MEDQEGRSAPANEAQPAPEAQAAHDVPQLDARGASRRRFTRAGAGAAGVVLTLHSQPGMATFGHYGGVCASPSGFMSIKSASHNPNNSCSNNHSYTYWRDNHRSWKSRCGTRPETRFVEVLAPRGAYAGLKNMTLLQILQQTKEVRAIDRSFVALQIVTALLNARASRNSGIASVLPEDKVVAIWDEFTIKGSYRPSGSARPWTGLEISAYLQTTFR
ncbi:MAG: hypothetical protein AB1807_04010 [Pseudomonadota bacterium]